MTRAKILNKLALAAALATLTGAGVSTHAAAAQAAKKCKPNPNPICYQIYAPVTCSNGQTYTNQCYADAACATGCVPASNPA
jgi:hypothetical protein